MTSSWAKCTTQPNAGAAVTCVSSAIVSIALLKNCGYTEMENSPRSLLCRNLWRWKLSQGMSHKIFPRYFVLYFWCGYSISSCGIGSLYLPTSGCFTGIGVNCMIAYGFQCQCRYTEGYTYKLHLCQSTTRHNKAWTVRIFWNIPHSKAPMQSRYQNARLVTIFPFNRQPQVMHELVQPPCQYICMHQTLKHSMWHPVSMRASTVKSPI